MLCDWNAITTSAYLTLIKTNINEFPISPNRIKCEGVIISSYQKYSRLTGVSISELTCGHELDDAFYLSGLRPDLKIILYNKDKFDSRLKHTLWHEIGHVKLGHKAHGEQQEIEAHFFASQANAPNVLIKEIFQRGYQIDQASLVKYFGLSQESAAKKMEYLKKFAFSHSNEYDDVIVTQFSSFLNSRFPRKSHYYDSYYEELDREREKW